MRSFLNFLDSVPLDPFGATLVLLMCLFASPVLIWVGKTGWPVPFVGDDCPGEEAWRRDWRFDRKVARAFVVIGCVCLPVAGLIGTMLLRRL